MGCVVRAAIYAGCETEASAPTLCCRVAGHTCWCCGDVGPTIANRGVGEGRRDTETGGAIAVSMCKGERGETEGVMGRAWPGERKIGAREVVEVEEG